MKVEFAAKELELIETSRASETRLPVAVILAARQRLGLLRAAPDMRTIRNWKSLGLRSGKHTNSHEVFVSPRWKIGFHLENVDDSMKIIVTDVTEQPQDVV